MVQWIPCTLTLQVLVLPLSVLQYFWYHHLCGWQWWGLPVYHVEAPRPFISIHLGQGNIFSSMCQEFCSGGYPSMHCRWYPSMPCRSPGGWYPSMHYRSPGPHPGGKLRCLAWGGWSPGPHWGGVLQACTQGGLQAHTQGVYQHALRQTPPSRWLLLWVVRILLKCSLVWTCIQ